VRHKTVFGVSWLEWSEWRDSNPRPLVPQQRKGSFQALSH
jgi:hypothetical protein